MPQHFPTLPLRSQASLFVPCSQPSSSHARTGCITALGSHQCRRKQHLRRLTLHAQQQQQPDPRSRGGWQQTAREPWRQTSNYDVPPPSSSTYRPQQPYPQDPQQNMNQQEYSDQPPTQQQPPYYPPPPNGNWNGGNNNGGGNEGGLSNQVKAMLAAAFIMGVGAGTWFESEATFTPQNVASTQIIDRRTPNSEVCMANGYSSMVFDQRIFVSFNPFNVYVTQPEVKPGCVLRRSNVGVLESRGLVQGKEVQACKNRMNTFAFVGDLDNSPEVSCVYHSEDAENQFLKDPSKSVLGDGVAGNAAKPSQ